MRLLVFLIFSNLHFVEVSGTGDYDGIAPGSNETIGIALNVWNNLTNVNQHLFARTFFNIGPKKLIAALESAAIVAAMPKGYYKTNEGSILKIIYDGIKRMSKNLGSLDSVSGVGNLAFTTGVSVPIGAVSRKAIVNNRENREEFLSYYNYSRVEQVVPYILNPIAWLIPRNVSLETHFNRWKFEGTLSLIAKYFFQAQVIQYFRTGIEFTGKEYDNHLIGLHESFRNEYRELKKTFRENMRYFRTSFFPGFIKEDIVRPVVDCIQNSARTLCDYAVDFYTDNCNIAHNIVLRIRKQFPWRNYAVIVSDTAVKSTDFAHFGYSNRSIVEENYNGKTVIVFMTNKNYRNNSEKYEEENGSQTILSQELNGNLDSILEYAKSWKDEVQMAVFNEKFSPCFVRDEEHVGQQLKWERTKFFFFQTKLGIYVVF